MSVRPKKSLGQNFLKDPNIIRKIVTIVVCDANDKVIEIGPGTGALTRELLNIFGDFQVIEVDKRACEYLKTEFPGLRIINEDVLKIAWEKLISQNEKACIIGNLPYYITSPILFSVLDNRHLFRQAVFMMQKEVARRLAAKPRTKDYGILSVQLQRLCKVQYHFTVSRNVFYPVPKVDSAVVSLTFGERDLQCSDKHFKQVVRLAFGQRRKKLANALRSLIPKEENLPFDLNRRAEELEPDEFENLTVLLEDTGILSD